jgi:hypothetical protein
MYIIYKHAYAILHNIPEIVSGDTCSIPLDLDETTSEFPVRFCLNHPIERIMQVTQVILIPLYPLVI